MAGKHLNGSPVPLLPIIWQVPDLFLQRCRRLGKKKEHTKCAGTVLVLPNQYLLNRCLPISHWRQLIRLSMLLRAEACYPAAGHGVT